MGKTRGRRWSASHSGLVLPPQQFSAACFLLNYPHVLLQQGWRDLPKHLQNSDVLRHQKWRVYLSYYGVVVIACLRGESICTANGRLHNPISLYCVISTVGLPQGVGEEELGIINRKMTSAESAPFSTYCWLASWFRADKQIWPESCCSILRWHQHSGRIGNIGRGGHCGCDFCRPLPAALTAGACLSVAET